jgi:protein TonB
MLNVLLESRAPRTRRAGGTLASTLVHAAIVSGAVALTVPGPAVARVTFDDPVIPVFPAPPAPPSPASPDPSRAHSNGQAEPQRPAFPPLDHLPTEISQVDPGDLVTAPTDDFGRGFGPSAPIETGVGLGGPPTGPLDQRDVDRVPRLLPGSPEPRFPEALRARNQTGRVVVQFVVDTLGRAEQRDVKFVEATDPAFVDAVRAVLPRYRFTPGEAGGRKVRTVVQLPFDFALR